MARTLETRGTPTSAETKAWAMGLGAELCGIASVERFADAPLGFRPADILPGARSVVVLALRWPEGTIRTASQAVYTFARCHLAHKVDTMAFAMAGWLEEAGWVSAPMPSNEPYDYWDTSRRHGHGVLSLRHAAVHAGLGRLGRNTLLINEHFGNLLWLGAVVTEAQLEPDPVATYDVCAPGCDVCLASCPAGALDGITVEQAKCRAHASKVSEGGGFVYDCNTCRVSCPNVRGL